MAWRRRFNGQDYTSYDESKSKTALLGMAKGLRRDGWNARVTKEGNRYVVWRSVKRRE